MEKEYEKERVCVCVYASAGDVRLISGLGRYPGERNGTPLQYCCLGDPMDRGA